MENNSDESNDDVTLVLGDNRIRANKKKLADHSLYFASLFSENFKDHMQNEFKINYDISLRTLKHFVNWINNEGERTRVIYSTKYFFFVRASLEIFLTGLYAELLELLELSVVFMAEKLTENIVEMIVCMRLTPDKMLEIWLMAENLSLKTLRDVALADCLDRFDDLPVSLLVKLPIENFLKLVLNVNVKSSIDRLQFVRDHWKKSNEIPKDLPHAYVQFLNGDPDYIKTILDRKRRRYVQCVVGHKLNKSLGIWSWNGKVLQELTEMTDSQMHSTFEDNGKEITGRQVIGGGFNVYLVGGEQGIGCGCFNMALWRYCPFSKKWYIITLLPRPRRHMAVAFIGNKLYLFGGVGRHRLKLSSVDIFDVHTGLWSKGPAIPEEFTDVPLSCVDNKKFIYYKSFYSIYDTVLGTWSSCGSGHLDDLTVNSPMDVAADIDDYDDPILSLVGTRTSESRDTSIVYRSIVRRNIKKTSLHEDSIEWPESTCKFHLIHTWIPGESPTVFDQQIINWPYLVSFAHGNGRATVEVGELRGFDDNESSIDSKQHQRRKQHLSNHSYRRLKIYSTELNNVATDCFNHRIGCFNLIDPDTLHTLVSLTEQESISV